MKTEEIKVLKSKYIEMTYNPDSSINADVIYAPYIPICTKLTVCGPNGTKTYWQIGYWMRFKLFINRMFHKTKKL